METLPAALARARVAAEEVLRLRQRFPERVFTDSFGYFGFIEHAETSSFELWKLLQGLAAQFGDREISILAIDPDAFDELHARHGEAGVQSLAAGASADDYHRRMVEDVSTSRDGVGLVLYLLPILAWLPDSLQWAAWGERDYSTIVFGFRRPPPKPFAVLAAESGLRAWGLNEVLSTIKLDFGLYPGQAAGLEKINAYSTFCREFIRNYEVDGARNVGKENREA